MPENNLTQASHNPSSQDFEVKTMPQKFLHARPSGGFSKKNKDKKSKKKSSGGLKKNLIIGLIVVVVLGVLMAGAAWMFVKSLDQDSSPANTQSPNSDAPQRLDELQDETSTSTPEEDLPDEDILDISLWQSYQDATYGFEVKYPSNWSFSQATSTATTTSQQIDPASIFYLRNSQRQTTSQFSVFEKDDESTLLSFVTSTDEIGEQDLEEVAVNNQNGYKHLNQIDSSYTIYLSNQNYFHRLHFMHQQQKELQDIFSRILNSFNLITSSVEQDPADDATDNIASSLDQDQDGLTDIEEELYQSNPERRDSDGDSYTDGDEVANLYDPTVAGNARLYEGELVNTYINQQENYNIVYPAKWSVKESQDSVIFQDKSGEFVQVLIYPNSQGFSRIEEWYVDTNPQVDLDDLSRFELSGQEAVRTPDGMQAYLIFSDKVYSLVYNIGLKDEAHFLTTFDMIIKSFELMHSSN